MQPFVSLLPTPYKNVIVPAIKLVTGTEIGAKSTSWTGEAGTHNSYEMP